jgi:hypothetical protein
VAPLDEVKRLLDGTVDPDALEANPELYDMAETIYGRDTLEHLGVEAPERPSDSIFQPNGDSKHEVEMPLPNLPTSPDPEVVEGKRSWIIFSLTFTINNAKMMNVREKIIHERLPSTTSGSGEVGKFGRGISTSCFESPFGWKIESLGLSGASTPRCSRVSLP